MIYRAIIQTIENNGYRIKVRIPFFDKMNNTTGATSNYNLYTASVCTTPGCKPSFVPGDVVYVDFENNDYSLPVIVGVLHRRDTLSSSDIYLQSLNVEVSSNLPEDTSIGEVSKDNIKTLIRATDNIQAQLTILSESGGGGGEYPTYNGATS